MFCHPYMADCGLHLMMNKACIIDENLCENMKKAFIDDVLNMMKIPEDIEHDNISTTCEPDAGIVHADDDEGKCLFTIICTHRNEYYSPL